MPAKILGRKNSSNVMKVLWCCDEIGIPFDRLDVGGPFGYDHVENYGALNPNQRVPTLDDNGFILWESNVIVRYLAEKHSRGKLFPSDSETRWEAEKWMDWQQTRIRASMLIVFRGLIRTLPEDQDPEAIENGRRAAAEAWGILDRHLQGRNFVTGDEFTMGDIPVGSDVYRWFTLDIERPPLPNLEEWYGRLCARKPYRTHCMLPLS